MHRKGGKIGKNFYFEKQAIGGVVVFNFRVRLKFAEGIGAGAVIGVAAGFFLAFKAGKQMRAELKKSSTTVTIQVHGLEKLK